MPQMKDDSARLKTYVEYLSNCLAQDWHITPEQGRAILKKLEDENYFTVTPPKGQEKPVEMIFIRSSILQSMTSYKPGNIAINLRENWTSLASFVVSAVGTVAGFDMGNPLVSACGIISMLLSGSDFGKLSISENGAAVIMALQNRGANYRYSASEQQCFQDANAILTQYNYNPMEQNTFQREIQALLNYRCIGEENGILYLRQKVVGKF